MAYDIAAENAAERHMHDAAVLFNHKRFDNAGYHFGLAAECAVKSSLIRSGVPSGDPVIRRLHFPELRGAAIQALSGRRASALMAHLKRQSYMQGWDISMRYASTGSVFKPVAEGWRDDANAAIGGLY